MRATHLPTHTPNRSLDEPVYVDEVFPEDVNQDDPWARKETGEEELSAEPLSFEDDEEEEEVPVPPSPKKIEKPASPRAYRVKIPVIARRPADNRQVPAPKSLPPELPRPTRRDRPLPSQDSRREERTGTWPVFPQPKRNGTPRPKTDLPVQRGHFPTSTKTPVKEPAPPERSTPRPIDEESKIPAEVQPAPVSHSTREPENPPPILPLMPALPTSPQRVFPVEAPLVPPTSFRPLVDEVPEEAEITEAPSSLQDWEQDTSAHPPTGLRELTERLPLPANSLILGVCDDGLPLVLELADPSPGALLVLGEDINGLRKHLQAVLASVCLLSDPKQVQVDIITPQPEAFASQKRLPHVQKIHLPDQDEMFDLLGCLFELIEQRQRKGNSLTGKLLKEFLPKQKDPVRILMIDQLDVLVEQLAPESLAYLRWLLRRGPAANVWVLASLNAQNARAVDGKTLKAFGLQIAGTMQNQPAPLPSFPANVVSNLVPGERACLRLNEEVVEFSILNI